LRVDGSSAAPPFPARCYYAGDDGAPAHVRYCDGDGAGVPKILIVDDEPGIRFGVRDFLESEQLEVEEADSVASAERAVREGSPDAVILDHMLPDGTALDLLPRLKELDPSLPVVVLTGHASIDLAVRAVKEGAEHFLAKPVELPALVVILRRLLESRREKRRQIAGRTRQAREAIDPFVGGSLAIRELAEQAARVASSSSPILIEGETGAGKGVLARWLHRNGPRADEPFVDMNCAGLSREFLETELFGHEKGAYTGAVTSKPGLLEVAHRGVVFLDEIGDLDPQVQPKVLKVLEEKRFRRLGEVRDRQVDIQLIAATHQDLAALTSERRFRSDLYYRINTLPLRVPALRERAEDIPVLARRLLEVFAADLGRRGLRLSTEAEAKLVRHRWPGNVRELRNVLERAILLSGRDVLEAGDLRVEGSAAAPVESAAPGATLTLDELERQHITRVVESLGGRVAEASQRLGIPRSTLYQKIKKYGIPLPRSS
jgi:DNA-binding NtrC family response regulator